MHFNRLVCVQCSESSLELQFLSRRLLSTFSIFNIFEKSSILKYKSRLAVCDLVVTNCTPETPDRTVLAYKRAVGDSRSNVLFRSKFRLYESPPQPYKVGFTAVRPVIIFFIEIYLPRRISRGEAGGQMVAIECHQVSSDIRENRQRKLTLRRDACWSVTLCLYTLDGVMGLSHQLQPASHVYRLAINTLYLYLTCYDGAASCELRPGGVSRNEYITVAHSAREKCCNQVEKFLERTVLKQNRLLLWCNYRVCTFYEMTLCRYLGNFVSCGSDI